MRVLTIDIETTPNLVWKWGDLWRPESANLQMLVAPTRTICVAGKWLDERKVMFASEWKDGADAMIARVHSWLEEADVVVHFNGIRFDIPHINREIATRHLMRPSPYKHVDLKNVVQQNFNFPSSKLAYVAPALHLEEKMETGGFGLWIDSMAGDDKARRKMEKYNKQDVRTTEQLFLELRDQGWLTGKLPHAALVPGSGLYLGSCPHCGSDWRQKRGYHYTPTARFPKYQCMDCHRYYKGNKAEARAKTTGV